MSPRRPLRIELPELSPAQAESLWNFLDDLASDFWDSYGTDLLQLEQERAHLSLAQPDLTDQCYGLGCASCCAAPVRPEMTPRSIPTSDQATPLAVTGFRPGPVRGRKHPHLELVRDSSTTGTRRGR